METQSSNQSQTLTPSEQSKSRRLTDIPSIKWLLFLAVLYTLYFAQSLIIPLLLAVLVALLLSPLVAACKRVYIPRTLSSIVLLSILATPFTLIGLELIEPAQKWAKLVPKLSVHLTEKVETISEAFEEQQQAERLASKPKKGFTLFGWFTDDEEEPPAPSDSPAKVVNERIKQGSMEFLIEAIGAAPLVLAQFLSGCIFVLFLLIFGPDLFQAFVRELPTKHERQRAMRLINVTQQQLSRYISTVSSINLGLGLSTAALLYVIGLEDALLWGVIVGVLNFIPYLGSIIGVLILSLAGVVQYGVTPAVLLPISAYLSLNLLESQFITPMVLGRNMQLNPLVVMVWLLTCGWLWGLTGVLLSVPILVCIKLALAELGVWKNWLRIIEAGA
ncbi:AI-2E family transporter [Paraglaciecola aestuariivivens]